MTGLLGIAALLGAAYALCDNRKAIRWRTVGTALALQALMAGDPSLAEIEINPLILCRTGAVAVDAVIREGT